MISDYRCFFCFARSFEKILERENISAEAKNRFTYDMISLYKNNWNIWSAPEFARELHNIFKNYSSNADPYKRVKRENNDQAIRLSAETENTIRESKDPFAIALRASIAGNIIDFAAGDSFNLKATLDKALHSEFAIDHSRQLQKSIRHSGTILFLGDNAGEIVFDKLFIETIKHPNLIYVVRGAPVINDATLEDAEYVAMRDVAKVISNEYDAPSTIPGRSGTLFQEYFKNADLIISKGQGNLEGLLHLNDKRIFFLLMVKCEVIAELLNVPKNSFIVFNNAYKQKI